MKKFHEMKNNKIFSVFVCLPVILIFILVVYSYLGGPIKNLSENQILYFFSSAAQVIAALYGLSVTGYVFLNDSLEKAKDKDKSLVDIIISLKERYFDTIILMSIYSFFSVFLSLFCIWIYKLDVPTLFIKYSIYIAIIIIILDIFLIILFSLSIIDPKKIIRIGDLMKKSLIEVRKDVYTDSFSDFMKEFRIIEKGLYDYYAKSNRVDNRITKTKKSLSEITKMLLQDELIDYNLFDNLLRIIKYRNFLVHSSDMDPEKSIIDEIRELRIRFEAIIKKVNERE